MSPSERKVLRHYCILLKACSENEKTANIENGEYEAFREHKVQLLTQMWGAVEAYLDEVQS